MLLVIFVNCLVNILNNFTEGLVDFLFGLNDVFCALLEDFLCRWFDNLLSDGKDVLLSVLGLFDAG